MTQFLSRLLLASCFSLILRTIALAAKRDTWIKSQFQKILSGE